MTQRDKPIGITWWKKVVFALGILMVIGAVTYSLVIRHSASTLSPPAASADPTCNKFWKQQLIFK